MIYPYSYEFDTDFQVAPDRRFGYRCQGGIYTRMKPMFVTSGGNWAYLPAKTVCDMNLYTPAELEEWNSE